MITFSLLFIGDRCLFTSLISKIPAFVLFLRNFYARGWGFFNKFPTRREFFVYLKIISASKIITYTHIDVIFKKLGKYFFLSSDKKKLFRNVFRGLRVVLQH